VAGLGRYTIEMKLHYTLGDSEEISLVIKRNWFTGNFRYFADGTESKIKSPYNITTHFNINCSQEYQFEIGVTEKHFVKIKHTRPLLLAGVRPQTYEIEVNGKLLETYRGY